MCCNYACISCWTVNLEKFYRNSIHINFFLTPGVLPKDDSDNEDLEIDLVEEEPPFLNGHTKQSIDLSPVSVTSSFFTIFWISSFVWFAFDVYLLGHFVFLCLPIRLSFEGSNSEKSWWLIIESGNDAECSLQGETRGETATARIWNRFSSGWLVSSTNTIYQRVELFILIIFSFRILIFIFM